MADGFGIPWPSPTSNVGATPTAPTSGGGFLTPWAAGPLQFGAAANCVCRYICILTSIRSLVASALGDVMTKVSMQPEPFPTRGSFAAYVMPGQQSRMTPQVVGHGRYYAGLDSRVTVRVVGRSLKDSSYEDTARLTDTSTGLLRAAHAVANALEAAFLLDDDGITPLVEQPIRLLAQARPRFYSKANEWCYVDLVFEVKYALAIAVPDLPWDPDFPVAPPLPSNLADILLAVRDLIVTSGVFAAHQVPVSLYRDSFPVGGRPSCQVAPGDFSSVAPDWAGAGRYFDSRAGQVVVTVIHANLSDQSYLDLQRLANPDPLLGAYAKPQDLVEALELSFPVDPDGRFLLEEPLSLASISAPRYYAASTEWCSIDLAFDARYQMDLSV